MAHKTLVGGTAYDTKGGKCLVGGTGYSIKKGRTLVGGTGYDINFTVGISSISLTYSASSIIPGETASPTVTINPTNYDPYKSITYSIISGSSYASINSSTGVITGIAAGTVKVKVTIVDACGNTVTATASVTVKKTYTITITGKGYRNIAYVTINGTTYTTATTVTVPSGTRVVCGAYGETNQGQSAADRAKITVNGTVMSEGGGTWRRSATEDMKINLRIRQKEFDTFSLGYGLITVTY